MYLAEFGGKMVIIIFIFHFSVCSFSPPSPHLLDIYVKGTVMGLIHHHSSPLQHGFLKYWGRLKWHFSDSFAARISHMSYVSSSTYNLCGVPQNMFYRLCKMWWHCLVVWSITKVRIGRNKWVRVVGINMKGDRIFWQVRSCNVWFFWEALTKELLVIAVTWGDVWAITVPYRNWVFY